MFLKDFDYQLPAELIAHEPVKPRDACRLLCLDKKDGALHHDVFYNIFKLLKSGDVLVLNKTKVIPCRIKFKEKRREIFITEFLGDNLVKALVKPGKSFKTGEIIHINDFVEVKVLNIENDGQRIIKFISSTPVEKLIYEIGEAPLPPYIKESKAKFDDYQTIYAKEEGSLAAPTAGLHFTNRLLEKLAAVGIQIEYVTLHVGLGTFMPVKVNNIEEHIMHKEIYEIDSNTAKSLNRAKKAGKRIIAVGTTSVRALESASDKGQILSGRKETDIFIYPGYKWRFIDGMITNFHLPGSTLLMLVSAFADRTQILEAYAEAIKLKYRFFSFGDAMLIL
jgi:S-adenosylmethionine:tRNA ribosyltransferase-isomerase